ncbi:hypothetical protein HYZ98_01450 [Candidatus Peregrinibacteria bacterium]|nr:hypothetical protein [Candidatus Peregrinibacteria bacterium]
MNYISLWPVWMVIAVLMVNLLRTFLKLTKTAPAYLVTTWDIVAMLTIIVFALSSVLNLVFWTIATMRLWLS